MSGFEVAGLILGAIPIIVSALQQYKTTREKWRYFRGKALYIDRLIDSLEEQRVLIDADLEILFRAMGLEGNSIALFHTGDRMTILDSDEVSQELREYLGQIYDPYRNALAKCENALKAIVMHIGGLTSGHEVLNLLSPS